METKKIKEWVIKNKIPLILILLFLVAFLIRLAPMRVSHIWDETVYLQHSEIFFSGRDNFSELSFRPPFLSILFYFGYFIWHSPFMAHIIVALFSSLSLIFIYLICRDLYDEETGLFSAILIALSPFLIYSSHYLLTGVVSLAFMTISTYFFLKCDSSNRYCILAGFFLAIAFLTRFTSVFLALLFIILALSMKIDFKSLVKTGVASLVFVSPYLIWAKIKLGSFLSPFILARSLVASPLDPKFFYLKNMPVLLGLFALIGIGLYVAKILVSLKRKEKTNLYDLAFIIWGVLFVVYMSTTPHKELRYIIPFVFPAYIISAKGFSYFFTILFKKFWGVIAVLLLIISSPFISLFILNYLGIDFHFIDRTKSEQVIVSEYIRGNLPEGCVVYSNYNYPVIAYYSGKKTVGLWPQNEKFYDVYPSVMPEKGYFVTSFAEKHPTKDFVENDDRFNLVEKIGNVYIYNYSP